MALGWVKLRTPQCHQGPDLSSSLIPILMLKPNPFSRSCLSLELSFFHLSEDLHFSSGSTFPVHLYIYFFSPNWNHTVHNFGYLSFQKYSLWKCLALNVRKPFISFFFLFLLAVRHCMQDLSSWTGDWLPAPCIGNMESLPLDHQEGPHFPSFEWLIWNCEKNP